MPVSVVRPVLPLSFDTAEQCLLHCRYLATADGQETQQALIYTELKIITTEFVLLFRVL